MILSKMLGRKFILAYIIHILFILPWFLEIRNFNIRIWVNFKIAEMKDPRLNERLIESFSFVIVLDFDLSFKT